MDFTGTEVRVARRFISYGLKYNCLKCPVALAIREMLFNTGNQEAIAVAVAQDYAAQATTLRIGNVRYELPYEMIDWIELYDHGREVRPISFRIGKVAAPPLKNFTKGGN